MQLRFTSIFRERGDQARRTRYRLLKGGPIPRKAKLHACNEPPDGGRSLWYDVVVVAEKSMRKVSVDPENIMCCKRRLVIYHYAFLRLFGLPTDQRVDSTVLWRSGSTGRALCGYSFTNCSSSNCERVTGCLRTNHVTPSPARWRCERPREGVIAACLWQHTCGIDGGSGRDFPFAASW